MIAMIFLMVSLQFLGFDAKDERPTRL